MTHITRRTKLLVCALLALLVLAFAATPVLAATADTGDTEASVSFTAGQLKLNSVPVLNFGEHPISAAEESYVAESATPTVQVSDLRGNGKGWDLMVALTAFTLEGEGATLAGASITLKNPTVSALNGTVGTPPAATTELVLTSDNTETPVWRAGVGEGMGVWGLAWNKDNITLTVKPGTAEEGTSVASLHWSLQATP